MLGPTLLQGSTRCGVSTKGLAALLQLVGPWGTRDMGGDVTAARMRAVGPGPAQGLGDSIQLEPSCSTGMLYLHTSTSLPVGRILTVL